MILLNILFTEKQLQKHYKIDAKKKENSVKSIR